MSFSTIKLEMLDSVALLTLNRPDSLNALSTTMGTEFLSAMLEATDSNSRAMVLTGEGRAFCAGGDLREMQSFHEREGRIEAFFDGPLQMLNDCILTMRNAPFPIVAAVNGVAFGAGCNFALACDLVIAGESAKFSESFVKIGLSPDCGGTYLLPRLIGTRRAAHLMMTGETIDARRAEEIGLINMVVPDDNLMQEALKTATSLAGGPTGAITRIKRLLDASSTNDCAAQLEAERVAQIESSRSNDFKEGVDAFFQKRPPKFTGS